MPIVLRSIIFYKLFFKSMYLNTASYFCIKPNIKYLSNINIKINRWKVGILSQNLCTAYEAHKLKCPMHTDDFHFHKLCFTLIALMEVVGGGWRNFND